MTGQRMPEAIVLIAIVVALLLGAYWIEGRSASDEPTLYEHEMCFEINHMYASAPTGVCVRILTFDPVPALSWYAVDNSLEWWLSPEEEGGL
jgi:hypothetical protein